MAQQPGGRHGGLFFVIGAMVVAAGVIAYFALGGALRGERRGGDATIEAPKVPAATPR